MAFTVHPTPHHVYLPDEDRWEGGAPDPEHPHHVEVDVSTGLVGYTRLTDEQVAEQEARAAEEATARASIDAQLRERQDIIRARAKEDPAFKALAEHLGISLEDA